MGYVERVKAAKKLVEGLVARAEKAEANVAALQQQLQQQTTDKIVAYGSPETKRLETENVELRKQVGELKQLTLDQEHFIARCVKEENSTSSRALRAAAEHFRKTPHHVPVFDAPQGLVSYSDDCAAVLDALALDFEKKEGPMGVQPEGAPTGPTQP